MLNIKEELDKCIQKFSLLQHPFYLLWNEGKLPMQAIQEYAKQYYHLEQQFPIFLSMLHSNCPSLFWRQKILKNLTEEEQGKDNHPELWMRFCEGLELSRMDVLAEHLLPATNDTIQAFKTMVQKSLIGGTAALYAYESQIPGIAEFKRKILQEKYGITDKKALEFFAIHAVMDKMHAKLWLDTMQALGTEKERKMVFEQAEEGAKILWHFLDGCYEAYVPKDLQC